MIFICCAYESILCCRLHLQQNCLKQFRLKPAENSHGQSKAALEAAFVVFLVVIRTGFKPVTHSLEGCCSIQLSYRTI
jgi:hypothetical protein